MILSFSAAFLVKLLLTVVIAATFYGRHKGMAESFVCGWLVVYESLIALMLALSAFEMMNRAGFLIGGAVFLFIAIAICLKFGGIQCFKTFFHDLKDKICKGDTANYITVIGIFLLFLFMVGHNSLFFDSTWDAHTYQIPRIELFVQKASLFVNMNSEAINIFSNEWNGELNAIFYAVVCGTNQGMFLANAENFIYSLLVVYWFCAKIGIKKNNLLIALVWYCSMPVNIFLSMTVKGDFVVIPFFLATVAWLREYIKSQNTYSLFFFYLGGVLAAGSKISMVPFVGLCVVSIAVYLAIDYRGRMIHMLRYFAGIGKLLLLGIICACVGCARYLLNLFFFGELFKRVDTGYEKINLSWQYLGISAAEIINTLFDSDNMFTQEGLVYALGMDMGIVGTAFVLLFLPTACLWLIKRRKRRDRENRKFVYVWFPIVGSLLFFMSSTMWFPWSFRYYAPWVLVLFFGWLMMLQEIFADVNVVVKKIAVSSGAWLGIMGLVSTIVLTTRFGEVTHSTWKEAERKNLIEREYGFHPYLLESYDGSLDIYDFFDQIKSGKKVLICNSLDSAVSYLFGEDNSNDVTFCILDELLSMISNEEYDVVSVSDSFLTPEIETYFGSGDWICYTPSKEVLETHIYVHI